jgi:hypothetical protein
LHSTKWSDGKKKRDGNHSSQKKNNNNLIQDSEGNEENRYTVPDSKKTKITNTKEPSNAHKKHLQRRNTASNH